jgi:hypothetical protein
MASGPLNSSVQPDSTLVGGVRNVTPPAPADGQTCALQVDTSGNLKVNVVVGGSGGTSNINIAQIGGVAEALSNPLPVELSDGTNQLGTPGNPLNVSAILIAGAAVIGHVIVDSGTITTVTTVSAVTAITNALPIGSNTIGKVDILGNAGVVLDAVLGAAKPANVLQVGGNDGTNAFAIPLAAGGGSVVISGAVTQATSPWVVSGTVAVSNLPVTQPVSLVTPTSYDIGDLLTQILFELRAQRHVLMASLTEDGMYRTEDFNPSSFQDQFITESVIN